MMGDLKHSARLEGKRRCEGELQKEVTIDVLPDNVLLEIFHFYKDDPESFENDTWNWRILIHVCRRWRRIIFGSPQRLDLRLHCYPRTPTRRLLDIWPPFPIALYSFIDRLLMNQQGLENIIAALKRRDRISYILIVDYIDGSVLENLLAMMNKPFPVLKYCCLISGNRCVSRPVLPKTFLGGSAPLLQSFTLDGISFPTFPDFILSSTQIQCLVLSDIPDPGYISPNIMASCLAALPNLGELTIGFRSPLSNPIQGNLPPLKCAVLSTLTKFTFEGASEYFEDLITQIDTPQLVSLNVTFFVEPIFDIPRLRDLMSRTGRADQASVEADSWMIKVKLESQTQFKFELGITHNERLDRQLSLMTQIFNQQLPVLSQVEHFEIREPSHSTYRRGWEDELDRLRLLQLFRLLISVQSLFVSERFVHRVAASLKELIGERAMEMLPALHSLSLEGRQPSASVQDAIQSFVTARQLNNHPVVIHWKPAPWDESDEEDLRSDDNEDSPSDDKKNTPLDDEEDP